jgi:hypothetical protein
MSVFVYVCLRYLRCCWRNADLCLRYLRCCWHNADRPMGAWPKAPMAGTHLTPLANDWPCFSMSMPVDFFHVKINCDQWKLF